jgi:signal transduction histidine kinase
MEKIRILVVEDEVAIAEEIIDRLEGMGFYIPGTATSGEDAIKKAEEGRPDLVLMDIKLKGEMDGIEAAGQIRRRLDVPIVYLTAYSDRTTLERAKVTEPFGYVIKPFDDRDLEVSIEMALHKHGREKEGKEYQDTLVGLLDEQRMELELSNGLLVKESTGRRGVEKKLDETVRKAKNYAISSISREMRNPLTIAKGALELAQAEEDWKKKKFMEMAYSTLERQIDALDNMTETAGAWEGGDNSTWGEINLADAIEIVINRFRPFAARLNIGLEVDVPENLTIVSVNGKQLIYVLRNLLDNAVKFNREGGKVIIEARKDADTVHICVCDTGIGVAESEQEKIFERFYQADGSKTKRFKGTGVGLTIAREVVESHSGKMQVKSEPGVGSEFCFTLPVGGGS